MSADTRNKMTEEPARQQIRQTRIDSPQQRFPRTARLLKHSDFDRVYKQGKRHFSSHITVYYLPRTHKDNDDANTTSPRVGFTVGKALGGAVERNRIKRRLREAARRSRSVLAKTAPADVVINPKKSVLTLEFETLLEEVVRAFEVVAKKMRESVT